MSKMDALRALREARYAHTLARAAVHRAGTTLPGAARGGAAGPDATSRAQRPTPPAPASDRSGAEQPPTPSMETPTVEPPSTEPPEAEARLSKVRSTFCRLVSLVMPSCLSITSTMCGSKVPSA